MIKINNSNIVGVSLGDTQFSKIYKGIDLYWSKKPIDISDFIIEKGNEVAGDVVLWDRLNQEKITVNVDNVKRFSKDNYVPIGIVAIAPSLNVYGDGSGSMISLKVMSCNDPDNGTTNMAYNSSDKSNQPAWGTSSTTLGSNTTSINYKTINDKFINISASSAGYDWKTAESINNVITNNNYPAGWCCWRYHTEGTKQGDWYMPCRGEFEIIKNQYSILNLSSSKLINLGFDSFVNSNTSADRKQQYFYSCTENRYDQVCVWYINGNSTSMIMGKGAGEVATFAFSKI